MDPIGFALENFDADASWRTKQGGDGGMPIDAKVKLFDGQDVDGPAGLRTALLRYSPQFVRMFIEKLMTYARRPRHRIHRHADDPRHRARGGERTTTGSRPSCSAWCGARSSRCA